MSHGIQRFETGRRMSKAVVQGDTVYFVGRLEFQARALKRKRVRR